MTSQDFKGMVILIGFSIAVAFGFNKISPTGIALIGQWDDTKGVISAKTKNSNVDASAELLDINRIRKIVVNRERTIIDVRLSEFFDQGHIPGAINFPINRLDDDIPLLLQKFKKETPILVYCSGIHCTDSHTYATHLKHMGYKNVRVFAGGFELWEETGNEIQTGP